MYGTISGNSQQHSVGKSDGLEMWKRGGRSSALDRAQALLSAKKSGRGGTQGSTQVFVGGSIKARSAPSNTRNVLSDLSDLSSASEHGANAARSANAEKNHGKEGDSNKDFRPPSSLGGGSRFLKKVPPPTNSSQSPVSRNQKQQVSEPRSMSSSLWSSQTTALNKLAEIKNRVRSRKPTQEQIRQETKPAINPVSDSGISPRPPSTQSPEVPVPLSAQSSSDQSPRGNRFLKNKAVKAVESSNAAPAVAPKSADVDVRSRSRAANPVSPSEGLETKSARLTTGVSLESDEEDMKKLLGDSLDSTDYSFLRAGRPPSAKKMDKMFSRSGRRIQSTPPPAVAVRPSSPPASPRSPASPPRRSSPFRFTGQAQTHFSPSVLSPSPSPSPPERPGSSHKTDSPPPSLSSTFGRGEVLSLEELFPVGPGLDDPHSEMRSVSSEDFKINVMTLDDLVPDAIGFTAETPGEQRETKRAASVPGSTDRHQQLPKQEEEVLDYQSDFESESRTETNNSASKVSEHLQGDGDGDEVASEVREDSDVSRGRTDDDYSSSFSDTSGSRTSDRTRTSKSYSRSRDSRSSVSRGSWTSSQQSRRQASARKAVKEAAVQTQPDPLAYTWSTGVAALGPAVGLSYMNPTPAVSHTVSAEMVEAISTFNPDVFALNEMLKQQLALTRQFIESSRHLHSSLVKSLEPPNYRYTRLEDTMEYIRKHRPTRITTEEALEEVLREMRDQCM
ncbi:uncharacterized protein C19orf44 homolog [Stegastes partitus]|uniref:Uncharacterized protein C19orf44 homolog n=1 Tax=Stegastes partitus TaxID=144197 RepID=A0A3B5AAV2_9TELE|nr:PREDICTED: uncharacterized protein C19orf44 homolog [Stegastes partitus]